MSGSRPTVGIRISAEGADQARRQIEAIGPAGEAAMRRVATASAAAAPEMQRLALASDVANRAFVGMGGSLGRVGATFTGVSGVAAGLTAGFVALGAAASLGAAQIAKAGDAATAVLARLNSASGGLAQAQQVYEQLFRLSQQTGIAVAESAGAFSRFSVAAKEIGGTNDQVLRLVAGIQKAGIVAGASAQETGAAVQQLGQALASGRLQGDELRSLLENMPQLAQALAGELGVGIGRLREMGAEGKLTADTVFPALLRATERIGAEFDKMPVTMSRARDILIAATEDFGARLDRITGLSQTFARAMQAGASALRQAGQVIAPTDRERVDQAVVDAERRAAQARQRVQNAEPEIEAYQRRGLTRQQAIDLAVPALPGTAPVGREVVEAEAALREALARQREMRREDRELQRAEAQDAAAQARQSAQAAATLALKDLAGDLDARFKAREKYAEQIKKIDEAEARGGTLPQGVSFASLRAAASRELTEALAKEGRESAKAGDEAAKAAEKRQDVIDRLGLQVRAAEEALAGTLAGTAASREASIALETENQIRAAGIPDVERRTEAEKRAAEAIGASVAKLSDLKAANKEAEEAAKKAREWHDRSWNELAGIGERAFDRLGDAIVQAFVSGQGAAVNFGNVARAILSSVVADIAKLAVVNPVLNSIFPSTQPRATLSSAFGGSGGLGDLLGLSGLMPKDGLLGALGLGGIGSTVLISPASAGISLAGGASLAAGTIPGAAFGGLTLGGLFGGVGLGMGAGSLLTSLTGGNQAGGMVGSGLGSAAGALLAGAGLLGPLGPLLGGLLGGLAGGGLGGLFGPGESLRGYGLRLQSSAYDPAVGGTTAFGTGLLPIDRTFYDDEGRAVFAQAEQQVAATNAYLSSRNLRVAGASIVGGNRNGPDYSWADAGTVGEGFSRLRFSAADNAELDQQLRQRNFQGVEGLQAYVEGFTQAQEAIKALAGEAMPQFTAQMRAVNDNFEAAARQARAYGIAETTLTEARAKAVAALEAQRAETLRQSDVALSIRRLAAAGSSLEADLARQTEQARQELDSFGRSLDALALTAADKSARLVQLEEVQAAERAAIIARYGEQAAQALRQAGGSIRAYLDSLATGTAAGASPTDRLQSAQAAFGRDLSLARGGDRDALGRVTSSADALLGAGRDVYASGAEFETLRRFVTSNLANLPAAVSYEQEMLRAISALGGGIRVAVGIEAVRVITEQLNALPEADRARLVQAATVLRTVEEQLGQLLTPAQRSALIASEVVRRDIRQSMQRDLSGPERAGLVRSAEIMRVIQQTLARDLTAAERAGLVSEASVVRSIEQAIGRNLTAAERDGLVQGASVVRSIEQAISRNLTAAERASLIEGADVERLIEQQISRDLTAAERAGLVQAASVQRNVEQVLGRNLTDAERALIIESGTVIRGVLQTVQNGPGNVAVLQPEGDVALWRGIWQMVSAAVGAPLLEAETLTRTIRQAIETTETVQISRSIDDSLKSILQLVERHLFAIKNELVNPSAPPPPPDRDPGFGGEGASAAGEGGGSFAMGAAFSGGRVIPFANGGVPDLVNSPTFAPMALFGEAGPEAIMPLSRGRDGRLGVRAESGDGALLAEVRGLRQEIAAVRTTLQQVGVVVAQETRASGQAVAGALDDQTTLMRRQAAA